VVIKHDLPDSLEWWVFPDSMCGRFSTIHMESLTECAHAGSPEGLSIKGGCDSALLSLGHNTWKTEHNTV